MKLVVIVNDRKSLYSAVKKNENLENRQKLFFLNCQNSEQKEYFEKKGFKCGNIVFKEEEYRKKFLNEYIDLIGKFSRINKSSLLWWSSDLSSKNRFTSCLPNLLQEFLEIIEFIEHNDFQFLVICCPSKQIISSLTNYLKSKNIQFCHNETFIYKVQAQGELWCGVIRKSIGVFYHALRMYFRKCCARFYLKERINAGISSEEKFYVIKSFLYNHSLTEEGQYKDPFFGRLPEFLKNHEKLLILTDIQGTYIPSVKKLRKFSSYPIVPFEFFLSLKDIWSAISMVFTSCIKVSEEISFFQYEVSDIIKNELKRTFQGIQLYQLLQYFSTRRFLTQVSVSKFLLTYENNPWERMCMAAFQKYSPKTRVLGYQHAVVPQAAANMFISQYEWDAMPKPDKVLTTGGEPKRIMEEYSNIMEGFVEASCALRYEYLSDIQVSERSGSKKVLLALEGIFDVYKMVNYVLEQLKDSDYKIIIRAHPVLPVKSFQHKLRFDINAMPNVEISEEVSVKEDIKKVDVVIYWGTTVSLEALRMGRPVIHFDNGSILSYDSLFECPYLKWTVSDETVLKDVLQGIYVLNNDKFNEQREKALCYLKQYFYSVNKENLKKF